MVLMDVVMLVDDGLPRDRCMIQIGWRAENFISNLRPLIYLINELRGL